MLNRKNAHLYYSQKLCRRGDFENYRIKAIEPCQLKVDDLNLETFFLGRKLQFPNYINAITGGTKLAQKINERLVKIAKLNKSPIVTGSLNPYIKYNDFTGFEPFLKHDFVIANLSARNNIEDLKKAADKINTSYVSLHLNTTQELLQLAGDSDFKDEIKNITDAVNYFGDKLIVKGVGQGFTKESIHILKEIGVKNIDISGAGGTDFSKIELEYSGCDFDYPKIPTSESILNAINNDMYVIASGGIDSAKDVFLSIALGADITASAYYYLNLVKQSFYDAKQIDGMRVINFIKYMMISSSKTIKDINGKYEVIK